MKKPILTLLSCIVIAGFFACNKDVVPTPDPKPIVLNGCYDSTLIRNQDERPYTACWVVSDPVCGCDGITYVNGDVARYDHGVINYTKGPCGKKKKHKHKCDEQCEYHTKEDDCHDFDLIGSVQNLMAPLSNPVCGCDGVTYDSPEDAMFNNGVKSFTYGACNVQPPVDECHGPVLALDWICPQIYAPVLGCDGVTYSNVCEAEHAGILKYTVIADDCVDSSKISTNAICTAEYAPVCGCNGITYSNSCEATAAGVKSYVSGHCAAILPMIDGSK